MDSFKRKCKKYLHINFSQLFLQYKIQPLMKNNTTQSSELSDAIATLLQQCGRPATNDFFNQLPSNFIRLKYHLKVAAIHAVPFTQTGAIGRGIGFKG